MFEKLKRYFTPAKSMTADEVREYINSHPEGTFTLLDVRQHSEYEESHIPGAKLIPITQLSDSIDELDKEKPVIAYWAIGGRSRVAAQMLVGRGFKEVYNLQGGIYAWNGLVAEGPVELNMDMITGDETPSQVIRLAYGMEQSLGEFYRVAKTKTHDDSVAGLLDKLASIEEKHKQYLLELYNGIESATLTMASFDEQTADEVMEGGFGIKEFVKQNESFLSEIKSLLDLSMMLETQALDLYLRFADKLENKQAKSVLHKIGDEEKQHLIALGNLREQYA